MYSGITLPTCKGTNKEWNNGEKNIIEEWREEIEIDMLHEAVFHSHNRQVYKKKQATTVQTAKQQ